MDKSFYAYLKKNLNQIKKDHLFKNELIINSTQSSKIKTTTGPFLNFCSNNYLGLANNPQLINFAKKAITKWGYGLSSVRFICGTQSIHKELEETIASFLRQEDAILYSSCFDANGGIFHTLLDENDVIFSDSLNHASIIDGIRLSRAKKEVFPHSNLQALETLLQSYKNKRFKLIVTDGVFSMDGYLAKLDELAILAKKYNTLLMVDDSHGVGVLGKSGIGSIELLNVMNKVDIITGTLGKALGGASGGYVAGKKLITETLRQKSRPYLFSNTLAPVITATSIYAFSLVKKQNLKNKLAENTQYLKNSLQKYDFNILPGIHPITPLMLFDAKLAVKVAKELKYRKIYVTPFSYPVVPLNEARIRIQVSAAHSLKDIDYLITNLIEIRKKFKFHM